LFRESADEVLKFGRKTERITQRTLRGAEYAEEEKKNPYP
jgi:hypothetical protein